MISPFRTPKSPADRKHGLFELNTNMINNFLVEDNNMIQRQHIGVKRNMKNRNKVMKV